MPLDLMDSESELSRSLIDNSFQGLLIIQDDRIIFVDKAVSEVSGYTPKELQSFSLKDLMAIVHPEDQERIFRGIENLIAGNSSPLRQEFRIIRKDRAILWVDTLASCINYQDRPALQLAYLDITEHKQMEEELRMSRDELGQRVQERTDELQKAKEAAEAAVEAKATFLVNMEHELRTPINAVIGLTMFLLETELTREQRDYIETIRSSGDALMSVINDILDFSKIDIGKMELECRPFDLRKCIEDSMDNLTTKASEKGLILSYTFDSITPETIMGDFGKLHQILANLISNAINFTDQGEIKISVSSKKIKGVSYEIHFAVEDTGIGIPKEKINQLFQPFSQVDASTTRRYRGTGLNLAITKKLVEMMGGRIWADSELGKGSTFRFTIPVDVVQTSALAFSRRLPLYPSPLTLAADPLRILVAEDNVSNQRVLVEMLGKLGYKVETAGDGRDVLKSLESCHYDVVLMDVQMPEMNGWETTRAIRNIYPSGIPKIVAITAYALEGDREKCIEAGMDDYISKPVKLEELKDVLHRILQARPDLKKVQINEEVNGSGEGNADGVTDYCLTEELKDIFLNHSLNKLKMVDNLQKGIINESINIDKTDGTTRILILESMSDRDTLKVDDLMKKGFNTNGWNLDFCHAIVLDRQNDLKNLESNFQIRLDRSDLLKRLISKVSNNNPEILLVHVGVAFEKYPLEILSALCDLKSVFSKLRIGVQESSNYLEVMLRNKGVYLNEDDKSLLKRAFDNDKSLVDMMDRFGLHRRK